VALGYLLTYVDAGRIMHHTIYRGHNRTIARTESDAVWALRHQNPVFNGLLNHLELSAANVQDPGSDQQFMIALGAACYMLEVDHLLGMRLLSRYPAL
jgi:hypothetical protein